MLKNLDALIVDHAHCEQKAAGAESRHWITFRDLAYEARDSKLVNRRLVDIAAVGGGSASLE